MTISPSGTSGTIGNAAADADAAAADAILLRQAYFVPIRQQPKSSVLYYSSMATVLLLSGRAGCGKDAAASLLLDEVNFIRFAFADVLKQDVADRYGLSLSLFHTAAKDVPLPAFKGKTPRTLLLDHARIARSIDLDVYARRVATAIKEAIALGHRRIVISDWRYRREYEFLERELMGYATILCLRITRHVTDTPTINDPSEIDLVTQPMHGMIDNDASISDLRDALKSFLRIQHVIETYDPTEPHNNPLVDPSAQ